MLKPDCKTVKQLTIILIGNTDSKMVALLSLSSHDNVSGKKNLGSCFQRNILMSCWRSPKNKLG